MSDIEVEHKVWRCKCYAAFEHWEREYGFKDADKYRQKGGQSALLASLFGDYETWPQWVDECNPADIEVMQRIAGPHGYAIYRAMIAQKGEA